MVIMAFVEASSKECKDMKDIGKFKNRVVVMDNGGENGKLTLDELIDHAAYELRMEVREMKK
jgi:hypothetical protein